MTESESGWKFVNKLVKRGGKQLWRKRELQFAKDGVPYHWELKSIVQNYSGTSLPIEDGFCRPPLPVAWDHSFGLGTFPISVVVTLLHMYSNTIPVITSSCSLSVLSELGLQVRFLFVSPMHNVTTFAGDLVDHRFLLLLWCLLHMDQSLSHGVGWLENSLNPKGCTILL